MKQKNLTIGIVDYGIGNIGSIHNMLRYIGTSAEVISNPDKIYDADAVILPGVGHFDRAMQNLTKSGMADAIKMNLSSRPLPILGICLGMQLMCNSSEEGLLPGLGLINAQVKRFKYETDSGLKIPHMGWNEVIPKRENTILANLNDNLAKYYFVHSFHVVCNKDEDIIGETNYGIKFVSAFQYKNIIGVQFHPEKSHKFGIQLFNNFVNSLK